MGHVFGVLIINKARSRTSGHWYVTLAGSSFVVSRRVKDRYRILDLPRKVSPLTLLESLASQHSANVIPSLPGLLSLEKGLTKQSGCVSGANHLPKAIYVDAPRIYCGIGCPTSSRPDGGAKEDVVGTCARECVQTQSL